jgi:hypothetical protein
MVNVFIISIAANGGQLLEQFRQPLLGRLPHQLKIDVEVSMGHVALLVSFS